MTWSAVVKKSIKNEPKNEHKNEPRNESKTGKEEALNEENNSKKVVANNTRRRSKSPRGYSDNHSTFDNSNYGYKNGIYGNNNIPIESIGSIILRIMHQINKEEIYSKRGNIQPHGLINSGNNCFISSIIQILLYCKPFYNIIRLIGDKSIFYLGGSNGKGSDSKTPIINSIINLFEEFKDKFGEAISAESFYRSIYKHPRFNHLVKGEQEDAEEFMTFLLEIIHEESIESVKGLQKEEINKLVDSIRVDKKRFESDAGVKFNRKKIEDDNNDSNEDDNEDEDGWNTVSKKKMRNGNRNKVEENKRNYEPSIISQIFEGEFCSVIDLNDNKKSIKIDPFQHIQLDISDERVESIEDGFKLLSEREDINYRIKEVNKDNRQEEEVEISTKKQTLINKLPQVLVVQLKRFSYSNSKVGGIEKSCKSITFDSELKIPEECLSKNGQLRKDGSQYRLSGVVYHHGNSANGGHYTADVLRSESKWIRIDDTYISKVKNEEVINRFSHKDNLRSAYILMYEKVL
ncbi:mRNA-binding ubiquitin-specific protease UBP3 [Ascoidea rubescens DSM 1968]|uniref:Ubiquitin carboxyl-terminal hydrolase n=1 Tax=Ascoidea rubescens DSM 1968 TaxID=1344418 RepID=A0A1D2VLR9_9ASCO|nr:cysteine proteinase [Ascoidea rubescens DSM 1968]ODV62553.1 cysteine proteinase [Ascoidea rubescens DSM 1968]